MKLCEGRLLDECNIHVNIPIHIQLMSIFFVYTCIHAIHTYLPYIVYMLSSTSLPLRVESHLHSSIHNCTAVCVQVCVCVYVCMCVCFKNFVREAQLFVYALCFSLFYFCNAISVSLRLQVCNDITLLVFAQFSCLVAIACANRIGFLCMNMYKCIYVYVCMCVYLIFCCIASLMLFSLFCCFAFIQYSVTVFSFTTNSSTQCCASIQKSTYICIYVCIYVYV
ncbi:unnamed protein product [Ceratitis capitata]|uniref:(Mediterranean fruit fly) hypothetical protein n=1 Tax=Ceratitis capitata TaxID=7213 RepID=A0A811UM73_CERCA|nr:unnamed protein product [Ceratitis capitata]